MKADFLMDSTLSIHKFNSEDFIPYKSWFGDMYLNKTLGPAPDKEWLHCVLHDTDTQYYTGYINNCLCGIIGLVLPNDRHNYFTIIEFAVNPSLKHKGIGTKLLKAVHQLYANAPYKLWHAYVDTRNAQAQFFFEKSNWLKNETPDGHMYLYHCTYTVSNDFKLG